MSAVLRVSWLFFSAFPIQRWLGVLGVALLVIGLGAALLGFDWRVSATVGLIAFWICALFPAAVAGGGMLRALSAPHNHQLLPFFRVRVLLATGLSMALLVAPVCLVFFVPAAPNGQTPPVQVVAFALGALTATFLAMFAITGNWNRMFFVLPLLFALTVWLRFEGISFGALLDAATASAWLIFGVWYLRVRRIRPPMLAPAARFSRELGPTEVLPRAAAARAVLNGVIERSPLRVLVRIVGNGVGVGGAIVLLVYLSPPTRPPVFTAFIWPFVMMLVMAEAVYRLVRQSRLLWLHVPGSRANVLRVVEAALARRYLWLTAFNLALLAVVLGVQGPTLREIGWALALALSAALYGSYVGLASVSGLRPLILGCVPMLIVQVAVLGTGGAAGTPELATMLAVQLLGAGSFRLLAVRRWRAIDWQRFRPLRDNFL